MSEVQFTQTVSMEEQQQYEDAVNATVQWFKNMGHSDQDLEIFATAIKVLQAERKYLK